MREGVSGCKVSQLRFRVGKVGLALCKVGFGVGYFLQGLFFLALKGGAGGEKLLPVFMLFVSLLQIFGNYSIYPASTFFLTRTRQGKAALGNVILPFAVLLMFLLAEYAAEKKREKKDVNSEKTFR